MNFHDGNGIRPTIALNNQGYLAVAWHFYGLGGNEIYIVSKRKETGFSSPTLLSGELSGHTENARVVINENNFLAVTWYTTGNNDRNVFVVTKQNLGAFSSPSVLSTGLTANISSDPDIALNNSDVIAVSWYSGIDDVLNIYVSLKTPDTSWTTPKKISIGPSENISVNAKIAMNDSNQLAVTWYSFVEQDYNIHAATKANLESPWTAPTLLSVPPITNESLLPTISMNIGELS